MTAAQEFKEVVDRMSSQLDSKPDLSDVVRRSRRRLRRRRVWMATLAVTSVLMLGGVAILSWPESPTLTTAEQPLTPSLDSAITTETTQTTSPPTTSTVTETLDPRTLECGGRGFSTSLNEISQETADSGGFASPRQAVDDFLTPANADWDLRPDWHNLSVRLSDRISDDRDISYLVNEELVTYMTVETTRVKSGWLVGEVAVCEP